MLKPMGMPHRLRIVSSEQSQLVPTGRSATPGVLGSCDHAGRTNSIGCVTGSAVFVDSGFLIAQESAAPYSSRSGHGTVHGSCVLLAALTRGRGTAHPRERV